MVPPLPMEDSRFSIVFPCLSNKDFPWGGIPRIQTNPNDEVWTRFELYEWTQGFGLIIIEAD